MGPEEVKAAGFLVEGIMMENYTLSFDHVSTGYHDRLVLNDISLSFEPDKISALIGPNGAGKSTLIKAASGVLPIRTGKIKVDGFDISKLDSSQRARLISVIPQARNLPPAFTVREVVLMGRTAYTGWFGQLSRMDLDIVEQAMVRTNTLSLAERRMGELSGGEAQRVLLARAIAQQARVMLLDEPTTHLDIQYQINLLDTIAKLTWEDHLVILIAIHDLNLVYRYADHVSLLVNGEIQANGSPAEVMTPENLSKGYQLEMKVYHPSESSYPVILPRE
jgi:ABC-type cobalamin/Fe3+-siderophores transport system ATPase subunit